jgi:DNA-nicking Smr family endonuclease
MTGRDRRLSAEERELWRRIAGSARPLFADRGRRGGDAPGPREPVAASAPETAPAGPSPPAKPEPRTEPHRDHAPPATIDRRTEQRLRRGAIPIDARIDLHGLTQRRAHAVLHHFLAGARNRGWRTVLVITGKGNQLPEAEHDMFADRERGVLARNVPQWLASAEFAPFVSGFRAAHRRHGGHGALYVRVRRLR